jgi:hypothetical protein
VYKCASCLCGVCTGLWVSLQADSKPHWFPNNKDQLLSVLVMLCPYPKSIHFTSTSRNTVNSKQQRHFVVIRRAQGGLYEECSLLCCRNLSTFRRNMSFQSSVPHTTRSTVLLIACSLFKLASDTREEIARSV